MQIPQGGGQFLKALIPMLALALVGTTQGNAQILISDEFNYSTGSLAGFNGGTPVGNPGWTGSYTKTGVGSADPNNLAVVTPGLTYTDGLGNALVTAGNAVSDNSASARAGDYRNWAPPSAFTAGSTIWFSTLVNSTAASGSDVRLLPFSNGTDPGNNGGVGFDINGYGNVAGGAGGGVYLMFGTATTLISSSAVTSGSTYLLVGEITFSASNTVGSITGWINPNLNIAPTGGVTATGTLSVSSPIAAIRGGTAWTGTIDEFRVGDTFADVAPIATAVPEPASWALVGLGLGSLLLLRRRNLVCSRA